MNGTAIPRRYELKYVIPEALVDAVREAILPWCTLDRFCAARAERHYTIRSIYLDTPARDLYRRCREGRPRRLKVRMRTYEGGGEAPVFLEVKRKDHGLVLKTRGRIDARAAARLREGPAAGAGPAELLFHEQLQRHALEPTLIVRYEREAWTSTVDAYGRVTFDRRITCQPWTRWDFAAPAGARVSIDGGLAMRQVPRAVLLELKCTVDVPRWMTELVGRLGLVRSGYSKYCTAVDRLWGPATGGASFHG